jgi:hypothetical protein
LPDGRHHPLWKAATEKGKNKQSAPFSRHTTTTAFRLAIGHAFTSDYSKRFKPDLPPEASACPCGFEDRSFHHLVYNCARYQRFRVDYDIVGNWDLEDRDPEELFHDSAFVFLQYLSKSRAAFLPETGPTGPFDPG